MNLIGYMYCKIYFSSKRRQQKFAMNCKYIRKIVIFLLLLVAAISHIYFVVLKYLEFETYSSSRSELRWPIQLPDVTICSNNVDSIGEINWSRKEELKHIRRNSYDSISYEQRRKMYTQTINPFRITQYCSYTDYGIPCETEHYMNYFYGDCETISQGENPLDYPITGIKFGGNFELANYYKFHRQPVFVMVIHKPNTEPVFLRSNIIRIDLFSDVSVNLRKRVIHRQHDCIQKEEMKNKVVLNFEDRTQYSYEVCLTLCFQNFSLTQHKCILPQFYFKENQNRDEMCTGVRGDFSLDLKELCEDCKPLCEDYQFEIEVKNVELRDEEEASGYQIKPSLSFRAYQKSGGGMGEKEDFGEVEEKKTKWNFEDSAELIHLVAKDEGGSFMGSGDFKGEDFGGGGVFGRGEEIEDGQLRKRRWIPKLQSNFDFQCGGACTWAVAIRFESAHVTVTQEKLENDEFILIGTIGGVLCLWLGTSVLATLKLMFFLFKNGIK